MAAPGGGAAGAVAATLESGVVLRWAAIQAALEAHAPARVPDSLDRAAVAMVLRGGTRGIEVLLIRRAEHPLDPWSGQMAFPGGRAEPGDADLKATAMRETAEETGLDLARRGELLGALDEVRAMARLRPMNLVISPYVFRLVQPAEAAASAEASSVHWIPLAGLAAPEARATHQYVHQGQALIFPALRHEGLVIWGLTYRMLTDFIERVARGDGGAAGA